MSEARNRILTGAAALWIAAGMAWYVYVFVRDFYAANRHALDQLFEKLW